MHLAQGAMKQNYLGENSDVGLLESFFEEVTCQWRPRDEELAKKGTGMERVPGRWVDECESSRLKVRKSLLCLSPKEDCSLEVRPKQLYILTLH